MIPRDPFDKVQKGRLKQYDRLVAECRALYDERNRGYRDSVRTLGVLGVLYEFNGIAGRLRALRRQIVVHQGGISKVLRASLRDKLKDVINYGLIALMLLEDDNILGAE